LLGERVLFIAVEWLTVQREEKGEHSIPGYRKWGKCHQGDIHDLFSRCILTPHSGVLQIGLIVKACDGLKTSRHLDTAHYQATPDPIGIWVRFTRCWNVMPPAVPLCDTPLRFFCTKQRRN